jgi:hypothetical protein
MRISQSSSDFRFVRCVRVDRDGRGPAPPAFVGLGSCVRTADQMRNLRASPAFAKYKCETTRCEVDPSGLLVACWNVDLAKQLS